MNITFADTSFYQALLNSRDPDHGKAMEIAGKIRGKILTTQWVLTELLNAASRNVRWRATAHAFAVKLENTVGVEVVPVDVDSFRHGVELYGQREDKAWSLVDCISFHVMWERGIERVLTFDEHFGQAGFDVVE